MLLAALFTALIAAGTWIRIPLPPVPVTMQTFFVILAGLLLGWRGGLLSAGLYMALGLAGVPIFTGGGGIQSVLTPTFGYIVGFLPGAALAGRIIHERLHRRVFFTEYDDEPIARVEYGIERILTREQFGEWFPRRYVAEVFKQPEQPLLALALATPFLGFDTLDVR
jgi:hypothetical protein